MKLVADLTIKGAILLTKQTKEEDFADEKVFFTLSVSTVLLESG